MLYKPIQKERYRMTDFEMKWRMERFNDKHTAGNVCERVFYSTIDEPINLMVKRLYGNKCVWHWIWLDYNVGHTYFRWHRKMGKVQSNRIISVSLCFFFSFWWNTNDTDLDESVSFGHHQKYSHFIARIHLYTHTSVWVIILTNFGWNWNRKDSFCLQHFIEISHCYDNCTNKRWYCDTSQVSIRAQPNKSMGFW